MPPTCSANSPRMHWPAVADFTGQSDRHGSGVTIYLIILTLNFRSCILF